MLARFVHIGTEPAIDFYTIEITEDEDAGWTQLFDRFLTEGLIGPGSEKARMIMLAWLRNIGRFGIENLVLREEGAAQAIPPKRLKRRKLSGDNASTLLQAYSSLPAPRLYLAIFGRAVILLDGAMKTTQKAQDCPQVAAKFALINRICRSLDQLLTRGDLRILPNGRLAFAEDLTFNVLS